MRFSPAVVCRRFNMKPETFPQTLSVSTSMSHATHQPSRPPAGLIEARGTRFHFKTEVLRFGRVGRTYTRPPGKKLPDSKCSTKRHFIACEEKMGQLHASLFSVCCALP